MNSGSTNPGMFPESPQGHLPLNNYGHSTADPFPVSQQQKRQNSLSNYLMSNSNKRMPNPLQMPISMRGGQEYPFSAHGASGISNAANQASIATTMNAAYAPQLAPAASSTHIYTAATPTARHAAVRKSTQAQFGPASASFNKTPTPSSYDVPHSPNINAVSSFAAPNTSDAPDSNPTVDQNHKAERAASDMSQDGKDNLNINQVTAAETAKRKAPSTQSREMSEEEQQLATKLKETYKNIVNYEDVVQKSCLEISIRISQMTSSATPSGNGFTNSHGLSTSIGSQNPANNIRSSELANELWTVYHHNITLLDNYTDFLVTALKPTSNQTKDHFKTGKNIVDLYKIPRRMWVYGIVAFLEVLKNIINIFQEHEICACFIGHCFNIIANLTDPALDMEGWWAEKLGDLSRMAIALYTSRFIDWKFSAEYWYSIAMRTLYGHGKIYYHMCTVQQDNLDALVNIGKSVSCRDPFVPTQQYLRLVVENICTQRNILSLLELPIIDFIKIHKVLLSINTNQLTNDSNPNSIESIHDTQLQYGIDLVSRYGITFGSDSNGYNFFTRDLYSTSGAPVAVEPHQPYFMAQAQQQGAINTLEKLNFWLTKGSSFAIANINHIIGLGDSKNPFAKLFLLPEALKERKDKKDRKRKSKTSINEELSGQALTGAFTNSAAGQSVCASELSSDSWFFCLKFINKSVLELSIRILKHYLVGPTQASTGHVIIWFYFLIAIGEGTKKNPEAKPMFFWIFKKIFPWESMIGYLNIVLDHIKTTKKLRNTCREMLLKYPNYMHYYNEHENLPEVWKCWGTLWFDFVSLKTDYSDIESAGVVDHNIFDLPASGISSGTRTATFLDKNIDIFDGNNRMLRVVLLARFVADSYDFGLVRTLDGFKFEAESFSNIHDVLSSDEAHVHAEEFLYGDNRFIAHNFLETVSWNNQVPASQAIQIDRNAVDDAWFQLSGSALETDDSDMADQNPTESEILNYEGSEYDDDRTDYKNKGDMDDEVSKLYRQQEQLMRHSATEEDEFYNYNIMVNPQSLDMIKDDKKHVIDGDLGDRMDSNVTYITLDTNIWLKHCGRIFKCIRNKVFKIVIPLIVFQELRSLRKSAEATIADAATRSVIIIRELYLTREVVPLRFDGTVASDINETTEFEHNSNWRAGVDETILNAVNEHDEGGRKMMKGLNQKIKGPRETVLDAKMAKIFRYCILITDDRNMRLRAKSLGVASFQSKWLFTQLETHFSALCID